MRFKKHIIGFLLACCFFPVLAQTDNYQYALIEAVKQKNLGNIPGAIELYQMVINEDQTVAVAHYEVGTLYAMSGLENKAIKHLKIAYDLDPTNKWYIDSYVDGLIMIKDFKTAEKVLKLLILSGNAKIDQEFRLANVFFLDGNTKKAIKTLEKIEKKHGVSDKVILLKANIFEKDNKYKKALTEVEKIIGYFPESVEFLVVAAELSLQIKDRDLATKYYTKVFNIDSTNVYALTNLTDYYRETENFDKSFFFLNHSFNSDEIDYAKKMAILTYYLSNSWFVTNYNSELQELILTLLNKYQNQRDIHLFAADFFVQKRDYHNALLALEKVLVPGEKKYTLWHQGILLANITNNNSSALNISRGAYLEFADSVDIWFYKGLAEYNSELYNEAVETFNSRPLNVLDDDPDKLIQVQFVLAEAYNHLHDYNLADSIYESILLREPDNYLVLNNWSYYLSLRNESLELAKKMSYKAVSANPDNGTFLDTYAWILFLLGEFQEAEYYINLALDKGGENDPDINEHAGDIHKAIGSFHLAQSYYQKSIILGGNTERLLKKLSELKQKDE